MRAACSYNIIPEYSLFVVYLGRVTAAAGRSVLGGRAVASSFLPEPLVSSSCW
jgi:hypothetical protein